jgi:hypothetical protein
MARVILRQTTLADRLFAQSFPQYIAEEQWLHQVQKPNCCASRQYLSLQAKANQSRPRKSVRSKLVQADILTLFFINKGSDS